MGFSRALTFLLTVVQTNVVEAVQSVTQVSWEGGAELSQQEYVPGSDGTYSQNYQDVWFQNLAKVNGWKNGFFLDLGAYHGTECSNSALLEKKLGFKGICVEPLPVGFEGRSCVVVARPLSDKPNQPMKFYGQGHGQIKHIDFRPAEDSPTDQGLEINTTTIPALFACLKDEQNEKHDCSGIQGHVDVPSFIHVASLDVEGQEPHVLRSFPWENYKVGAWVVEQTADNSRTDHRRQESRDILKAHGYMQAPVENPGMDEYWILPEFWKDELKHKAWRMHPPSSHDC